VVESMSLFGHFSDVRARSDDVGSSGDSVEKVFLGDDQNFSGPLMPFARADMRDHIVSPKNNHGASYGRYGVLRCWSRLEISFCEISIFDFCNTIRGKADIGLMSAGTRCRSGGAGSAPMPSIEVT
jgi:hypothetical protein